MAGEVGHTCIDYQGLPCPCGRRGCWEQYASASALKRFTAQAQLGNPDSILARVIREHDGHVSGQSAFMAAGWGTRWASRSATCMWAIWRRASPTW